MFVSGVVSKLAHGAAVPSAPTAAVIRQLDSVCEGGWEIVQGLPLRGLRNLGLTCFVSSMAQVFMRIPSVVAWLLVHSEYCEQSAACPLCALSRTRKQVLEGAGRERPELAASRGLASMRLWWRTISLCSRSPHTRLRRSCTCKAYRVRYVG